MHAGESAAVAAQSAASIVIVLSPSPGSTRLALLQLLLLHSTDFMACALFASVPRTDRVLRASCVLDSALNAPRLKWSERKWRTINAAGLE